jgi:hypothetical protein
MEFKMLVDLKLVAHEIKNIGLYDFIYQNCQKVLNTQNITEEEIYSLLQTNNKILEEYKQTNLENNVSNIHFQTIPLDNLSQEKQVTAKQINNNIQELQDLEKYTLKFEDSPTLVFIFSIEFFVLFSAQYFIVLLGLKEWQFEIYGAFISSVIFAWIYAKKKKELYIVNAEKFNNLYKETSLLIQKIS